MTRLDTLLLLLRLALVVVSATAHGADLSLSKFTYEGEHKIGGVGLAGHGLFYRPASDTWFTIGTNGNAPFVVREFRLTAAGSAQVQDWGALNSDGRLNVSGGLVGCRGLLYDAYWDGFWANFGSFYANYANNNFLCFVKLDYAAKTKTIEGPWRVNTSVHSDTVKGKIDDLPDDLARATGYGFLCFGERGSTAQLQSWGPGVVFISRTARDLPPGSELQAKRVVHWPMVMFSTDDGVYGRSDFECDKSLTLITGPVSSPTFTTWNYLSQADGFSTMCVVDDAIVFTGVYGEGYSWYGAADKYAALNLDSLLYPGQKMKSVSTARGIHVEGHRPKIILMSLAAVMDAYKTGSQKLMPYETGSIQTLGGVVPMKTTSFSGTYFNKQTRKLYMIEVGAPGSVPIVRKWGVAL